MDHTGSTLFTLQTGLESDAMASLQGSLTPELSDVSVEYTRPSAIEPPNTSEFETSDAAPTTDNEVGPKSLPLTNSLIVSLRHTLLL